MIETMYHVHSRWTAVLLVLLLAVPLELSYGQEMEAEASLELMGAGGLANPIAPDDFDESWSMGYGYGGGIALPLSETLSIRPYVNQYGFSLSENSPFYSDSTSGGRYRVFTANADLIIYLDESPFPLLPYAVIGGGYYNGSLSGIPESIPPVVFGLSRAVKSKVGFNAGFGAEATVTDFLRLRAEGKFVFAFAGFDLLMFVPFTLGISIGT